VAVVIVLGTLQVEGQGRQRLRRKAFDAVRALGGGRDVAARVGAEVSDALRAVERPGRRVHLVVSVDPRSWGATLAFLVAWNDADADGRAPALRDAGAASRTLTYRLRVPPVVDEGLERVRRTLAARSREELFASLEATNEALRRSTAEARLAGAAKAQFLANMSHEIRTPMNAIVGMNRLALGTELSERQRGYLEKIESSTRHLLGIIDDVLDLSKLEAGKLTLERGEVVLGRLLDDVATLVGGACADKGLSLTVDVAEEVPSAFQGDALRLRQVLVNLVHNAVKFTAEGEVAISVQRLPAPADETALRFSVRDTGIGLSREQIAHLFTSFAQADATITRRYGGTGLGLAICKSLVELMRGEVGVESRPGEGSTFWFTARFGAADARAEARVLRPDLQGRRALVVDDVATTRQTLRRLLERMGLHVDEAGSGHAALRLLTASAANEARADAEGATTEGYDLVFLDAQMPDLDGVATATRLRRIPLRRRPGLFLTTAYVVGGVALGAADGAVDGVVAKPFDASVLFETVAGWFGMETGRAASRGDLAPPEPAAPSFDPALRVLMVEDNRLNQEVAEALLAEVGLTPTVAGDGAEALALLRREHFDLVLMDVQMPVMDGLSATRAIRADERLRALPVVAMTANALSGDREACLAAGMNDVVTKPIDPADLWRALAAWLPSRPAAGAVPAARGPDALPTDVPGLDVERGLRYARGRPELYLRLLRGFLDDQRDLPRRLRESLAAGDAATAGRLAHTLRGLASGLGAARLAAAGEALEQAVRSDAPGAAVAAAAATLIDEHVALFAGLDARL